MRCSPGWPRPGSGCPRPRRPPTPTRSPTPWTSWSWPSAWPGNPASRCRTPGTGTRSRSEKHGGSAVSGQGGVLPHARGPGPHPGAGAVAGRPDARAGNPGRHRDRALQPVPATGGPAPLRPRRGRAGRRHRRVLPGRSRRGRADARRAPDPHRADHQPAGPARRAARGRRDHEHRPVSTASVAAHGAVGRVRAVLPTAETLGTMRRSPRRDLVSGLTVAVVALPLALGFGITSGAGAQAGLVTAVIAGALAAVFGGSHPQVTGPT